MLDKVIEKARQHDSGGRCSVYCVALNRRGRSIAEGGNSYIKTHTVQAEFSLKAGLADKQCLHAEVKTLIACKGRKIGKLIIARVDSNGEPRLAKPCPICQSMIEWYQEVYGCKIDVEHT